METPIKKTLLILQPVDKMEELSEKAIAIYYGDSKAVIPVSQIVELTTVLRSSFKKATGNQAPTGILIPKWLIEKKREEAKVQGKPVFPWDTEIGAWQIGTEIIWILPKK